MNRPPAEDHDWTSLPPGVPLEETVAGHDDRVVPAPDDVRNVDQHAALRDD